MGNKFRGDANLHSLTTWIFKLISLFYEFLNLYCFLVYWNAFEIWKKNLILFWTTSNKLWMYIVYLRSILRAFTFGFIRISSAGRLNRFGYWFVLDIVSFSVLFLFSINWNGLLLLFQQLNNVQHNSPINSHWSKSQKTIFSGEITGWYLLLC